MSNKFIVTVSPHIRDNSTTSKIMLDVVIALMPALVISVLVFGARSLAVVAVCVGVAVLCEWGFEKICGRPNTIGDLSAVVTGVILAYNLPVGIPLWQAAFGSFVAIVVVKQLFGGIGMNFANPAITARIVMLIAFSQTMTTWVIPQPWFGPEIVSGATDIVSTATPLAVIAAGGAHELNLLDLFVGSCGGSLGETSALALLIGGVYLIVRKVIQWHTPVAFIGTVFVLTAILGESPVQQVLSGGLMLGAIFMATDYSTTPSTPWGRVIFGIGCGLITVLIRVWGNYPEGVSFSILLMNILAPYISGWTRSKPFGGAKA